jgi:LmbE family N-acetylglucosaminyl deacetylase
VKAFDRIYLSAHYDDAVFSCGGTIHRQCRKGRRVVVITVFAAPPDPGTPLSALARRFNCRIEDPVSRRRSEDRAALTRLGAAWRWLSFVDAIYRADPTGADSYYPQLTDLFGALDPRDKELVAAVAGAVLPPATEAHRAVIYAPLGIGNHVDHQLVHLTGRWLAEQGHTVLFYEDYPYADPAHPASAAQELRFSLATAVAAAKEQGATPLLSRLGGEDLRARVESMCAYRSQLIEYEDAARVIAAHLGPYVRRYDPPNMAERFWRLPLNRLDDPGRKG